MMIISKQSRWKKSNLELYDRCDRRTIERKKSRPEGVHKGLLKKVFGPKRLRKKTRVSSTQHSVSNETTLALGREAIKMFRQELNKKSLGLGQAENTFLLSNFVKQAKGSGREGHFPVEMVIDYLVSQRKVKAFAASLIMG